MRIASRPLGVDVDDGVGKIRDLMQKPMVGLFCDVVSLANAQCALYPQTDLGEEAVETVRSGMPLQLHPLIGGLPPDVAWRYLRTVTDVVMPAVTGPA